MAPKSEMKDPQFKGRLVHLLKILMDPRYDIKLAYLFGSMSKGPYFLHSDIDIGVFLETAALGDHWHPIELSTFIENGLKRTEFEGYPIDLCVINKSEIKFLFSVINQNPRIINRDNEFRIQFEKAILMKWYDMRPTWDAFYQERNAWLIDHFG